MSRQWVVITLSVLTVAGPRIRADAAAHDITSCFVAAIVEVRVPVAESGVLSDILVREGDIVSNGQMLAQLDDRDAVAGRKIAQYAHQQAAEQSRSSLDIELKETESGVTRAEHEAAQRANRNTPNVFSAAEVRRLWWATVRTDLELQKMQFAAGQWKLDEQVKAAQCRRAELLVERCHIRSPRAGVVMQIFRQEGDWVQAGESIVHVVPLERLRVHGRAPAERFDWNQLRGRNVAINVNLPGAGNRTLQVLSQIAFVSQVVEEDGRFRFWADIENPQLNGTWILGPGLQATVRIVDPSSAISVNEPALNTDAAESP